MCCATVGLAATCTMSLSTLWMVIRWPVTIMIVAEPCPTGRAKQAKPIRPRAAPDSGNGTGTCALQRHAQQRVSRFGTGEV